jgi:GH25 family lysozyme M1 (1,4-beta-N-acetylmuramidase)
MIIKQPAIVDGSHWSIVDWRNFDPNILAVIWKITQGKYYIDPTCADFWAGVGQLGLPRSVFHFFEPNDIASQVANYLTACEDHRIIVSGKWMAEIEPVLDAEYTPPSAIGGLKQFLGITPRLSPSKQMDLDTPEKFLYINPRAPMGGSGAAIPAAVTGAVLAAQYKAWLDGVEYELGIKPIIYTSKWMWIYTGFPAWASRYKLWDAQYPFNPDGQNAPLYVPYGNFQSWWLWQYSANATIQGMTGSTDINVYNGTKEEFLAEYGGGAVPPEPPPGVNMEYEVIVGSLSIRPTAGTTQAAIGYLLLNDHVTGIDTAGWVKLATWTRAGVPVALPAVNCYSATGNGAYLKVFTPPPATETATVTVTHEGKTGTAVIPLV